MRAVSFDEIELGARIVIYEKDGAGHHNFLTALVRGVDAEDRSIISNINGGLKVYPNEEDCYIVVE